MGVPPVLPRAPRERHHHLSLRDHGPATIAIPVAMLVVAALVIMAVAGVFGGSEPSPVTGRDERLARPAPSALHSVTGLSLTDAERLVARLALGPGPAPTTTTTATSAVTTPAP